MCYNIVIIEKEGDKKYEITKNLSWRKDYRKI